MLKHPAVRRFFYQVMSSSFKTHEYSFASFHKDYITKEIFVSGLYERSLLSKLKEHFALDKKGGSIIDVGANIGNHSVYFSKICKKVLSIEPNPACYFLIKANLLANSCENVTVLNKAVSDTIGTANLCFDYLHTGGGSILPSGKKVETETIQVETVTLDSLMGEVEKISCLKIDAEGHEVNIINGARNLLTRDKPLVVFEAHDLSALKRTAKALDGLGYDKFFDLVQSRRLSNKRLFNLFHYLFHPNKVDVSQVDFSKEKGYQMVVACPKGFTF